MGAGRAVPEVGDLAQVLRQVILMLRLRRQLHVPAEGVQPHRVGPARGRGAALSTRKEPSSIPNPTQSWDAEVAPPPPALCRHEIGCSESRRVLVPARHLRLPHVSAEMESQEKAQGLLALKALRGKHVCQGQSRALHGMPGCSPPQSTEASRLHLLRTPAPKPRRPSLGSSPRSHKVANWGGENSPIEGILVGVWHVHDVHEASVTCRRQGQGLQGGTPVG